MWGTGETARSPRTSTGLARGLADRRRGRVGENRRHPVGAETSAESFRAGHLVPGNHELWTTAKDPVQIHGAARYDYLVTMCREIGVITPEDPFPVWEGEDGPVTLVPMFLLYDYTFLPDGATTKEEGLAIAREKNVVATDEFLLSSEPYGTRDAWCRNRVETTKARLDALPAGTRTVLINHFPPGASAHAGAVVPGVLAVVRHRTDRGLAHPVQRRLRRVRASAHSAHHLLRRGAVRGGIAGLPAGVAAAGTPGQPAAADPPVPEYPPGTLNKWGGHFKVTPEQEAEVEKMRARGAL